MTCKKHNWKFVGIRTEIGKEPKYISKWVCPNDGCEKYKEIEIKK